MTIQEEKEAIYRRLYTEEEWETFMAENLSRFLIGPSVFAQNMPGGHTAFKDQGGFYLTHDEARRLIARLSKFYRDVSPDDLAIMNKREPRSAAHMGRADTAPGYVYLFNIEGRNPHKIGMTTRDIESRRKEIEMQMGQPVYVVDFCRVPNPLAYEELLLTKYGGDRLDGEWFELNANQVSAIRDEFRKIGPH